MGRRLGWSDIAPLSVQPAREHKSDQYARAYARGHHSRRGDTCRLTQACPRQGASCTRRGDREQARCEVVSGVTAVGRYRVV